jgi:uncharacterized protein
MNGLTVPFKTFLGSSLLGFTVCLLALPGYALTVEEVPNPREVSGGWVTDSAEILRPETEAQINHMIDRLEEENGAEMAVVTVPKTQPAGRILLALSQECRWGVEYWQC